VVPARSSDGASAPAAAHRAGAPLPWHQRWPPVARTREAARRAVFGFVRALFATDDGRTIAADALTGLLRWRANLSPTDREAQPYEGLGTAAWRAARARQPIFVTARFRSGSTLLWNLFRQVEGVTAYYEPFNERRWFDPRTRGDRVDGSHRFVADYWREYDGLVSLGEHYREAWTRRNLYMDGSFWEPAMRRYVEILVEAAAGRPVLQFNRVDFRLPWLRENFPRALILHLYRHPRDQWCSSLLDPHRCPKDAPMDAFAPHDVFYLRAWARDLKFHFPFLDEGTIVHPYRLFYYVWKLSYLFGRRYAHHSLAFEDLVETPCSVLPAMFHAVGIGEGYDLERLLRLVDAPLPGRWREYADERWFIEHEAACETVLEDFFGESRDRLSRRRRSRPGPTPPPSGRPRSAGRPTLAAPSGPH
ncbi:MAG: sulfotransferase, partial [Candidatus Binatia bacterium]